jgi:hypothetical protein
MDINEIREEIKRLEEGETSYPACNRLAILYACENGLKEPEPVSSYSFASKSEFMEAAMSAGKDKVYGVIDEHMSVIKELFPKEYDHVIRLIRE